MENKYDPPVFLILRTSCFNPKRDCRLKEVQTIYSIKPGEPSATSYLHMVLVEGLSMRCKEDSILTKEIINKYMDTVSSDSPVQSIELFNATKNFDPGETLGQPNSIYKNCLVTIWFDLNRRQPDEFIFL